MAQSVKALAAKLDNWRLILWTPMVEGEDQLPQIIFCLLTL